MELSLELPAQKPQYSKERIELLYPPSACQLMEENDIIDLTQLNFSDDENWLLKTSTKSSTDLHKWLHGPLEDATQDPQKNIDTRTFTRPKKRFTRPSIEKYNEELYGNEFKELTDSGIQLNGSAREPLNFVLNKPNSSLYFETILANAPMVDSFQNMSPPSLVNSMCSSTFANLMESSFIKNDPVLREIRDTDYTESILQQESEPMFQSITESCSSLNSDVPENFLKKVSFTDSSESSGKTEEQVDVTVELNATFAKKETSKEIITMDDDRIDEDVQQLLNATFQRRPKPKNTFKLPESNQKLNRTFEKRNRSTVNNQDDIMNNTVTLAQPDLNSTITLEVQKLDSKEARDEKTIENIKRLLDRRPSPSLDLNRLSYVADKNESKAPSSDNTKRYSYGSSDSGENLDYMSLSSGSSKSSGKVLSMDGINVIVKMQEQSLQIMSTPKPAARAHVLWQNSELSPINGGNSDPELSSNEKTSPRLSISANSIKKQRSLGQINSKVPSPKSVNTLSDAMRANVRGSQPNLNTATYSRPKTNLNSMGHTLKGSYTSLRPTNTNLPVAPPPLNVTTTRNSNVTQAQNQDAHFVKPQIRSNLPRPVTGIPRPVSRIPGPRNVRSGPPRSTGQQGRNH